MMKRGADCSAPQDQASCMSCQVTAFPPYGGIRLPFAIGAVVVGEPTTFHTPLSGHVSPVRTVRPIGIAILLSPASLTSERDCALDIHRSEEQHSHALEKHMDTRAAGPPGLFRRQCDYQSRCLFYYACMFFLFCLARSFSTGSKNVLTKNPNRGKT